MQSSLRTRRPSVYRPTATDNVAAPTARTGPRKLSKAGGSANLEARKSRVGDKIKKRMSMRYADISAPSIPEGMPIPAMPTISEFRQPLRDEDGPRLRDEYSIRGTDDSIAPPDAKVDDVELLAKENFDPDAYLKTKLANSTEEEIRSLQSSLAATKAATATDLQRNVYKNYAEFVLISKEISTLENDMLELKESLAEWKNMPSLLTVEDAGSTASTATDRRRTNRNSVADLRTLYASQLQELHAQIEGSSKFVPAIPSRHIVNEFSDLWALNSATYKIEYAVHVVLLDDSFLVAKKRKKRSGGGGKLVAERCWPLGDIVVVDVKDTIELTNVVKVRRGKETHVFRTDMLSDKKNLLGLFRQVSEELATKKRKEREGEHERRKSVWTGDRFSIAGADPMPSLPSWLSDLQSKGIGGGNEEKDVRWVGDFIDELSVAIALREWDEAVGLVERAQTITTSPASTLLPPRVEPLKASLTADLIQAISDPSHRKQSVIRISGYLIRLGAGVAARDAFLATRTELMRKRARMIRLEGNISLYISELALVTFTGIKHTAEWYLASFREHDMASGLVDWAKCQIDGYAVTFRKQVYGADVDSKTVQESIQITKLQAKRLLQEIGMDFSFLLETLVTAPVKTATTSGPSKPPTSRSATSNAPSSKLALKAPQPLDVPTRTRSPQPRDRNAPSPVPPRSPGIQTPMGSSFRTPGPLPLRSRERPMSGNVTPRARDNDI